jgi:hypothetical protein
MPKPPQEFNPNGQRRYHAPGWRGQSYSAQFTEADWTYKCRWCYTIIGPGQFAAEHPQLGVMHETCKELVP